MYLSRLFLEKLRKRKQYLLTILLRLFNDDDLKKHVAFRLWRHNAKKLELDYYSRVIQHFVGDILSKLRNKNSQEKLKRISDGFAILCRIKIPYRLGFKAIKSEQNRNIFTKFNNDLSNKRNNHLKSAYNGIRDKEKAYLLLRLFKIPESGRKRILRKFIIRFKDKAMKLARMQSAKMIHRNYRSYHIRVKFDNLNRHIRELLIKLALKHSNIKAFYFNKWQANAHKMFVLRNAKIICDFVDKRFSEWTIRRKWHKMSDLLNLHNGNYQALRLLLRIRKYIAVMRFVKPIKHRFLQNGWELLMNSLKYLFLQLKLKYLFENFDRRLEINSLRYALKKWKNNALRLRGIETSLNKTFKAINTRRIIIGSDTLNSAFLIKKLFSDIPKARAYDFFARLRLMSQYRDRLRKIGDNLLRAKGNLVNQNKEVFANKIYRIYSYILIEKMINNFYRLLSKYSLFFGAQFFDKLKGLLVKGIDFNYNGSRSCSKECPKTTLSFRAHVVNPKQLEMREENKDTYKLLIPYFNEYLLKKMRARKLYAMCKLKDNDRSGRFCKLYKTFSKKRMIPPKIELYEKLKSRSLFIDSYGEHIIRLFKLLKKYYIHKTCMAFIDPSRIYRLLYLIKLSLMHKNIAKQRFIREMIRKWRFSTFVKKMARRKLELMYKNLHLSYLQMANEVFGDEDSVNPSIIKEFERFGNGIGMFVNEDPTAVEEVKYCKGVSKKYIFEPVVIEEKKEVVETEDNHDYYVDQEIEGGTTGKYKSETNKSKKKK